MPGCLKQRHLFLMERFGLLSLTTRAGIGPSEKRLDRRLVGSRTSGLKLTQVWRRLTPNNSIHHIRVEPPVLVITNERDNGLLRKKSIEIFLAQSSHWELSLVCFHMIYVFLKTQAGCIGSHYLTDPATIKQTLLNLNISLTLT